MEKERILSRPPQVITKVDRVEVAPPDYEYLKHHINELEESLEVKFLN